MPKWPATPTTRPRCRRSTPSSPSSRGCAARPVRRGGAMRIRKPRVLVVERESEATRALVAALRREPLQILWARDDESAHNVIETQRIDGLVTALRAPRIDGLALL